MLWGVNGSVSCHRSLLMHLSLPHCSKFSRSSVKSTAHRRHHRRRLLKYAPKHTPPPVSTIFQLSDDSIQITLKPPPNSFKQLELRLSQFVDYGREAFDDLQTVITVDNQSGGVVISCKRSTVEFFVAILLSALVSIVTFRALFKLRKKDGEKHKLIYKRDRSLGGRVVAVGKREGNLTTRRESAALDGETSNFVFQKKGRTALWGRRKEQLPQWWPHVLNLGSHESSNKEEYQRMADQLIRAIMDGKMNGEDVLANDIVQLRHICKSYGVRANINTENARDSLYRVSVNFVLNYCESMSNISASVEINGEDARDFVAGLSHNIGLENTRAARMVSAAVAAHTRSKILQAWALEVQNKHSEALVELFKVCLIHRIFPPEESSPEMEMVAQGLEKSLSMEQRESIFSSFSTVCGQDMHQSVAEALGLGRVEYQ